MTWHQAHAAYLRSPHWRDLRERCLAAAGGKCARCGRPRFLQAHHMRYRDNLYDTRLEDLKALCVYCHAKHHGKPVVIPAAWLAKEQAKFKAAEVKPEPKKKPKWVTAMLARAAANRAKRASQRPVGNLEKLRSDHAYRLACFKERMANIVNR